MADVKWIKITTDIFDDEKILMIESMPSADSIIVIWFKLLTFAGKQNNNGVFLMSNRIAYTDEMLASIFRRDVNTVRLALKAFEQFGMIEIVDNVITIPNWGKHQTLDAYEKKKARDRERIAKKRAEQRALATLSPDASPDSSPDASPDVAFSEEERELEEELELEEDKKNTSSSSSQSDIQRVIDAWNAIGAKQIRVIVENTDRHTWLKTRIRDYGLDSVLEAIENVKHSDFLMGRTKEGFNITFDWFIRPNNFPKVLDGNYTTTRKDDANGSNQSPAGQAQRIGHYI